MHNMAAGAATAPAAKLEVEEDGGEAGGVAPPRKREKAEPEGATTHAAAAGASVAAAKATAEQVERVGAAHTAAGAYVTTTARGGEPGHPTVAKRKKFLHPPRPPTNVDMQGCTESYDDYQDTMGEVYKHTTEQLDEEKLRIYQDTYEKGAREIKARIDKGKRRIDGKVSEGARQLEQQKQRLEGELQDGVYSQLGQFGDVVHDEIDHQVNELRGEVYDTELRQHRAEVKIQENQRKIAAVETRVGDLEAWKESVPREDKTGPTSVPCKTPVTLLYT